MKTTFFVRTTLKKKDSNVRIRMRLRDGKAVNNFGVTPEIIKIDHWNFKKNMVKHQVEFKGKDDLIKRLRDLQIFVEDRYRLDTNKSKIDKDWLSNAIDQYYHPEKYQKNGSRTLFEFIQEFIDKSKSRINTKTGRPVCYKQQREYARTFYYLQEFCKGKDREYNFGDIDLDFYQDFIEFLQALNKSTNTIGKKIQTLKIMLNEASEKEYQVNKAYKSHRFKSITEESENIYLDTSDLQKLYDLDLAGNKRLETVRDLFLIGCWTGCRFGDIHKINSQNIHDGMIHLEQSKTGSRVIIPLHPVVKNILEKYDFKLPVVISNQKFNKYLKEVAKEAKLNEMFHKGITKGGKRISTRLKKWRLVTTHAARRSFATNLYNSEFPSLSIMQITGHKTEAAFLKYIKVTPEEHAKKLQLHWEKQGARMKIV
jgi:integrase